MSGVCFPRPGHCLEGKWEVESRDKRHLGLHVSGHGELLRATVTYMGLSISICFGGARLLVIIIIVVGSIDALFLLSQGTTMSFLRC